MEYFRLVAAYDLLRLKMRVAAVRIRPETHEGFAVAMSPSTSFTTPTNSQPSSPSSFNSASSTSIAYLLVYFTTLYSQLSTCCSLPLIVSVSLTPFYTRIGRLGILGGDEPTERGWIWVKS